MSEQYNSIESKMSAVIEDLRNKVNEVCRQSDGVSGIQLVKINDVRDRTIEVFNNAAKLIVDTYQEADDQDEVEEVLDIVKKKSKEFFINALTKIDEIKHDPIYEETKPKVAESNEKVVVQQTVNQVENKPEVKQSNDIQTAALGALKGWLKSGE